LAQRADFASTHFLARSVGPTAEIKMPYISDILDVAIEDPSPEQLQQLKDATDQFQQKCLMSLKSVGDSPRGPLKQRGILT
jgi:hypothetical protein